MRVAQPKIKRVLNMKYPPPRWVFVDVDGTLVQYGVLSMEVVAWIKEARRRGFRFVLWSARGQEYARASAERHEVIGLFEHIISKPGYIIDDKGWEWVRYTKRIWMREM